MTPVSSLRVGDQSALIDQCPSGWGVAKSPGDPDDPGTVGSYSPSILIRRGATALQFSFAPADVKAAETFAKKFPATYR